MPIGVEPPPSATYKLSSTFGRFFDGPGTMHLHRRSRDPYHLARFGLEEDAPMATIETQALAQGLSQVESSWQKYVISQKNTEGLSGSELKAALKASAQDYKRFKNHSQQFYAEVRKRVTDAEKLEQDKQLYPHYYT